MFLQNPLSTWEHGYEASLAATEVLGRDGAQACLCVVNTLLAGFCLVFFRQIQSVD